MATPMTMVRRESLWMTCLWYLMVETPNGIRDPMMTRSRSSVLLKHNIGWIVSLISRWHSRGRECPDQCGFLPEPRRT
eukprot:8473045-Pyramimonas_sp.AAC.1